MTKVKIIQFDLEKAKNGYPMYLSCGASLEEFKFIPLDYPLKRRVPFPAEHSRLGVYQDVFLFIGEQITGTDYPEIIVFDKNGWIHAETKQKQITIDWRKGKSLVMFEPEEEKS